MLRTALGPAISAYLEDPEHRRGDAQPRRSVVDRPVVGRPRGHRLPRHASRRRADRAPRRASCRRRSACQQSTRLGRAAGKRGTVRGTGAAGGGGAVLRHPAPGRRGVHARRLCRFRHHVGGAGGAAAHRGARTQERARRRRHLYRQDHAGQRSPRRSRQDRRPRRPDRGHARAAMRRAEPGRASHQGWRGVALRSRPFVAASPPGPHSHRRGARRGGARPA